MWSNSNGQHWYKSTNTDMAVSLKTDTHRVGGGMVWSSGDIKDQQHIKTTTSASVYDTDHTGSRSHHDSNSSESSLPLCWLMSFPVSIHILCAYFVLYLNRAVHY